MDHDEAPVLNALADYHRLDRYGFTPPAHRQGRGRGVDERVAAVLGGALRMDVLATAGLDDRTSSNGYLAKAEEPPSTTCARASLRGWSSRTRRTRLSTRSASREVCRATPDDQPQYPALPAPAAAASATTKKKPRMADSARAQ